MLDHVGDPVHVRERRSSLISPSCSSSPGSRDRPGNDGEDDAARADGGGAGLLTGLSVHRASFFLRCGCLESYPLFHAPDGLFQPVVRQCQREAHEALAGGP